MGRTFYTTDLEIQKAGIWKKDITILFGIKNNPYIPIVSLVGVGVGEVFERKNWKFSNHVTLRIFKTFQDQCCTIICDLSGAFLQTLLTQQLFFTNQNLVILF